MNFIENIRTHASKHAIFLILIYLTILTFIKCSALVGRIYIYIWVLPAPKHVFFLILI